MCVHVYNVSGVLCVCMCECCIVIVMHAVHMCSVGMCFYYIIEGQNVSGFYNFSLNFSVNFLCKGNHDKEVVDATTKTSPQIHTR